MSEASTLCTDYIWYAGGFVAVARWFVIAALLLGIAYAIVETIKKYKEAPAPGRLMAGTIKEVVDALKAFLEALAAARAWLALFACGLLLFWFAGHMLPTECQGEKMKQAYVQPGTKANAPTQAGRRPQPGGGQDAGTNTAAGSRKGG